ncbi:hypothetical protein ACOI1C_00600 [Bacillus sp. DJP31]|uniref:hypothetical protein n=1 Tax=Bacillus sp. DJP31 TaxID=3409789 RepID=UPI003BB5F22C
MHKKQTPKNFVYEVEVSNHDEEFALELFEMLEDTTQTQPTSHKKIHSFEELLEWNEELEEE